MVEFSYWEHKHFFNYWDFCVVGGGITGLTTAIFIKRQNPAARVTVLERGVLPAGASTKNAGFACFGSISEILDDLSRMDQSDVYTLIQNRFRGLAELRKLINDKDLGFIPSGGYEVFTASQAALYERCMESLPELNRNLNKIIGSEVFIPADDKIKGFGFQGVDHLIGNPYEGTVDTGSMMLALTNLARHEGVNIYNGVEVRSIDTASVTPVLETSIGTIKPGKVVIATNGFASELLPGIDLVPARAQVLITRPIDNLKPFGCFHHEYGYNYFRNIDNRILLGGGRHLDKTHETTTRLDTTAEIQEYLESILRDIILPGVKFEVERRWSGIMGMGSSKRVILEAVGPSAVVAVRFGGMGVALGTFIGQKAAALISGKL